MTKISSLLIAMLILITIGCGKEPPFTIKTISPSHTAPKGGMWRGSGGVIIHTSMINMQRRNVVASFEIHELDEGFVGLSASKEGDEIYHEMKSLGAVEVIVPAGSGSTYRFHGTVSSFLHGYTFKSDPDTPLTFTMTDTGLQFAKGKGKVILPNGKEIDLNSE